MKRLNNILLKIRHSSKPIRLIKSSLFLQNFLCLMGILTVIFLIFSVVLFSQSRSVLKKEFTVASQYKLEETSAAIDSHIDDMRYIIATLDTNSMIRALFSSSKPKAIYDNYYSNVQEVLKAYVNGFSSIDSIYLYSQYSETILTTNEHSTPAYFTDMDWLDSTGEKYKSFYISFRKKNNAFPNLLSIQKQFEVNGYKAAIVINLRLEHLVQLSNISKEPYQSIYLVSDDSQILFRNGQEDIKEPLDTIPELVNFQKDTSFYTELIENGSQPYTYTQIRSEKYPWSYVMITHLQEYTSRLSSSQALFITVGFSLFCAVFLLSFLLSMRSVKPIRNLLQLFQNPDQSLSTELFNDKEIAYIAEQITSYMQKNQALSDELTTRLNLLNQTKFLALQSQINPHFLFNTLNMIHIQESEILGYEHKIPKLTLGLSRLLRYAIESTDLVPLETELEFTRTYIDILQNRYGNKPRVVYDIDHSTYHAKVPKLFIQPIVENAVFHGLAENMSENSILTLTCHLVDDMCVLSVKDNGVGMKTDVLEQLRELLKENVPLNNIIGIKNVTTRMNLLYGDAFSIEIKSIEGEGSVFSLRFPFLQ